jgi:hypothetical protein
MSLVNAAFSWPSRRSQGLPKGGRYASAREKAKVQAERVPEIIDVIHCGNCDVLYPLLDNELRKDARCPLCMEITPLPEEK